MVKRKETVGGCGKVTKYDILPVTVIVVSALCAVILVASINP